jgi:hypothetical protein
MLQLLDEQPLAHDQQVLMWVKHTPTVEDPDRDYTTSPIFPYDDLMDPRRQNPP